MSIKHLVRMCIIDIKLMSNCLSMLLWVFESMTSVKSVRDLRFDNGTEYVDLTHKTFPLKLFSENDLKSAFCQKRGRFLQGSRVGPKLMIARRTELRSRRACLIFYGPPMVYQ